MTLIYIFTMIKRHGINKQNSIIENILSDSLATVYSLQFTILILNAD